MIITIDGPVGSGKSTVARAVAKRLGFVSFDTGAMYRSITYLILKENVALSDPIALQNVLKNFIFCIKEEKGEKQYFVNEENVSRQIRLKEVTNKVSEVAAIKTVRETMVKSQREFADNKNVVCEGRDMGTVVFPQAEIKIFLTCDLEIRAERRYLEMLKKYQQTHVTKEEIKKQILQRDLLDEQRKHSPLICPHDAYIIDTTDFNVEQVIEKILQYYYKKTKKR